MSALMLCYICVMLTVPMHQFSDLTWFCREGFSRLNFRRLLELFGFWNRKNDSSTLLVVCGRFYTQLVS